MSDSQTQPNEFPVPFAVFAASIKGTPDEVYSLLLKIDCGDRPRTPTEWQARLHALRDLPTI